MPATMPSTANPVVTVEESFMLSNGKSPVRISHKPSKSIPRFLPAKLFVIAITSPFFETHQRRAGLKEAGLRDCPLNIINDCCLRERILSRLSEMTRVHFDLQA